MPLSALVQTPKFTTATVLRPYTHGGSRTWCSHGFQTQNRPNVLARHIHTTRPSAAKRGVSLSLAPPSSGHLTAKKHHALTGTTTGRAGERLGGASRGLHTTQCVRFPARFADIEELYHGNVVYMADMTKTNPGLLQTLARQGQKPPFMLVDCSDSRVNESGIFSAQPGTIFTAGNIANRFDEDDLNSNAVLSFAVESLKVKHVVVMGHYGCGGVAAAMLPPPAPLARPADVAVQGWISPIREIYENSTREEIVAHRKKCEEQPMTELPDLHCPAFRALVEENVKSNVEKIAKSAVIRDHYAYVLETHGDGPESSVPAPPPPKTTSATASSSPLVPSSASAPSTVTEIYIHGWVYDVENGKVSDLGVSVGPAGRALPPSPFPLVHSAHKCCSDV